MKKKTTTWWMNVYPHPHQGTRFPRGIMFPTKAHAVSFAVPGILGCVRVKFKKGDGLDIHEDLRWLSRQKD